MQETISAPATSSGFNFSPDQIHTDHITSSLKDLLVEINREEKARESSIHGREITLSNLKATLAFLSGLTGRTYASIAEPLPYSFLKTVKLLYRCSQERGAHILEYLKLPDPTGNPATFEFRLSGQAPRNETKMRIVLNLLSQLEKGIRQDVASQVRGFFLTPSKLLQCIEIDNKEILAPIRTLPTDYDAEKVAATAYLAKYIGSVRVPPALATNPVNEALYLRILSLPFLHFVGEYQVLEELAELDFRPETAEHGLHTLCESLGQTDVNPCLTQYASISSYPEFFEAHATALIKIVSTVTALPIQRRDLAGKTDYVQKLLHLHVFNERGRQPLDAKLLTLADIVAAICTVAHQQKVKTPYSPHWQGKSTMNSDKKHNVLTQLESTMRIEDLYEEDYVPHGVNRLLLNRFSQFHAYMLGYGDRYRARRAFELARLVGHAKCLKQTDINDVMTCAEDFNDHCMHAAQRCAQEVIAHKLLEIQDTRL